MNEYRKMAEELHLEYLKDCSGFVDIVSNALRSTASKSEKDATKKHMVSLERIQRSLLGVLGICPAQCELNDRINAELEPLSRLIREDWKCT